MKKKALAGISKATVSLGGPVESLSASFVSLCLCGECLLHAGLTAF